MDRGDDLLVDTLHHPWDGQGRRLQPGQEAAPAVRLLGAVAGGGAGARAWNRAFGFFLCVCGQNFLSSKKGPGASASLRPQP